MARKKATSGNAQSGRPGTTTKQRVQPPRAATQQSKRARKDAYVADESLQVPTPTAKRSARAAANTPGELDAVVQVHRHIADNNSACPDKESPAPLSAEAAAATIGVVSQKTQQVLNAGKGWEIMMPATLSKVFDADKLNKNGRIAAFDLDAPLVTIHVDDDHVPHFKWFNDSVLDKLRDVPKEGSTLVLFCGRGAAGGALHPAMAQNGPHLLDALQAELAVPAVVCLSAEDDDSHLPGVGAWHAALKALRMDESQVDKPGSFIVGAETGGAGEDTAGASRALASAVGMEFCSAEEYFGPPKPMENHDNPVPGSIAEPSAGQEEQAVGNKSSVEQAEQVVEETAEEARRLSATPPKPPASHPGKPVHLEKATENGGGGEGGSLGEAARGSVGSAEALAKPEVAPASTWWPC